MKHILRDVARGRMNNQYMDEFMIKTYGQLVIETPKFNNSMDEIFENTNNNDEDLFCDCCGDSCQICEEEE